MGGVNYEYTITLSLDAAGKVNDLQASAAEITPLVPDSTYYHNNWNDDIFPEISSPIAEEIFGNCYFRSYSSFRPYQFLGDFGTAHNPTASPYRLIGYSDVGLTQKIYEINNCVFGNNSSNGNYILCPVPGTGDNNKLSYFGNGLTWQQIYEFGTTFYHRVVDSNNRATVLQPFNNDNDKRAPIYLWQLIAYSADFSKFYDPVTDSAGFGDYTAMTTQGKCFGWNDDSNSFLLYAYNASPAADPTIPGWSQKGFMFNDSGTYNGRDSDGGIVYWSRSRTAWRYYDYQTSAFFPPGLWRDGLGDIVPLPVGEPLSFYIGIAEKSPDSTAERGWKQETLLRGAIELTL